MGVGCRWEGEHIFFWGGSGGCEDEVANAAEGSRNVGPEHAQIVFARPTWKTLQEKSQHAVVVLESG